MVRDDVTITDSDGETMTDLYRLMLELFSSPFQVSGGVGVEWCKKQQQNNILSKVVFYLTSVWALGVHLWEGWPKAVQKMAVSNKAGCLCVFNPYKTAISPGVTSLGRALILPLCSGFAACVLYAAWLARAES